MAGECRAVRRRPPAACSAIIWISSMKEQSLDDDHVTGQGRDVEGMCFQRALVAPGSGVMPIENTSNSSNIPSSTCRQEMRPGVLA